jgi:hypothetical protein
VMAIAFCTGEPAQAGTTSSAIAIPQRTIWPCALLARFRSAVCWLVSRAW